MKHKKMAVLLILSMFLLVPLIGCGGGGGSSGGGGGSTSGGNTASAPASTPTPTPTQTCTPVTLVVTPTTVNNYSGSGKDIFLNKSGSENNEKAQSSQYIHTAIYYDSALPSGHYKIGWDGTNYYDMTATSWAPISHYYYGNPENYQAGPLYLFVSNPNNQKYAALISGDPTGDYYFNINGDVWKCTNYYNYVSKINVIAPTQGQTVNFNLPVNVGWNSLGANYRYFIIAYCSTTATEWNSAGQIGYSWTSPNQIGTFLANNTTQNTSLQIPANIFSSGNTVKIYIFGYNTNYLGSSENSSGIKFAVIAISVALLTVTGQ